MTQEEKAKRYEQTLERAREAKQNTESAVTIGILEEIFPELKESEDERILEIIKHCIESRYLHTSTIKGISQKQCLAWLEKQGKPTEINPSEFDLRLNKLLKQFESLPKEELISNLSYYLNVIQNDSTYKIEKQDEKLPVGFYYVNSEGKKFYSDTFKYGDVTLHVEKQKQGKESTTIDANPVASYDNVMISDIEDEGIDNISPEGSVNYVVTNSNNNNKQGEQKPNPCDGCINRKGCINCENGELRETKQKPFEYENATIQQRDFAPKEPKFKVGDWITNGDYTWEVTDIAVLDYVLRSQNGNIVDDTISYTDEQFYLWTIQDAKDGDVLYHKAENGIEYIVMSKGLNENNNIDSYFRYNSINGFGIDIPSVLSAKNDSITPATKEQRDTLMKAMADAGWEFDFEKKELKKIEQKHSIDIDKMVDDYTNNKERGNEEFGKPVPCMIRAYRQGLNDAIGKVVREPWSEEDEEDFDIAIKTLCESGRSSSAEWLKSLKERIGG